MNKLFFYLSFPIGLFITSTSYCIDALTLNGNNPQMNLIGKIKNQEQDYQSYGTRQLGAGIRIEENWFSFMLADPRDDGSERTNSALLEYRKFGDYQLGLTFTHFKNFKLKDQLSKIDLEIYQTHGFILKNINNPEYSLERALLGLEKVDSSGWALFGGVKLSNSYLHTDGTFIVLNTDEINNINGYTLGGLVGVGGTLQLNGFYVASDLSLGFGPTYTTWNDRNGRSSQFNFFEINSHIFDLAFGYSGDKTNVVLKISTLADTVETIDLKLENLSTSSGLILTYRF